MVRKFAAHVIVDAIFQVTAKLAGGKQTYAECFMLIWSQTAHLFCRSFKYFHERIEIALLASATEVYCSLNMSIHSERAMVILYGFSASSAEAEAGVQENLSVLARRVQILHQY